MENTARHRRRLTPIAASRTTVEAAQHTAGREGEGPTQPTDVGLRDKYVISKFLSPRALFAFPVPFDPLPRHALFPVYTTRRSDDLVDFPRRRTIP